MKKSNATRHGTRRISRRRRKVRRFIRKVKPFFVLTIVGVTIAIMICKIIALAAPLREVTEETRSFGLDLTEVRRIHQEHQEAMQERNNASRDAAMQIAQGMGNRETEALAEVQTITAISTTVDSEQIASSPEPITVMVTTTEVEVPTEEPIIPMLSAYGPGEVYYYAITDAEKMLIAKVVWKEARGESFEGQVAVAATVFNRLMCNDPAIHNDSIYSVVTQSGAYASISDVTEDQARTCMEAVEQACRGYDPTRAVFENGARFFYAQDWIRYGVKTLVIGGHTFHDDFAN